jgi:hypothetical protein
MKKVKTKGLDLMYDWVKALRSGDFVQGYGRLRKTDKRCKKHPVKHCCLGVLREIVGENNNKNMSAHNMLTGDFFEKYELFNFTGGVAFNQSLLADKNDTGAPFSEIADFIEERYIHRGKIYP